MTPFIPTFIFLFFMAYFHALDIAWQNKSDWKLKQVVMVHKKQLKHYNVIGYLININNI